MDPEWNSDHPWFVVLAVSPQKVKASRQWEKDRNCGAHYMNNWGWDEIFAAFRYFLLLPFAQTHLLTTINVISLKNPKVGLVEINLLYTTFTCFGPVPRTCLETIPAESGEAKYNKYFRTYLAKVDHEIRGFVRRGGQGLWNDVSQLTSHRIALMYPTNEGTYYTARLATWWIAYRVAVATEKESNYLFYGLFRHLSAQPQLCTSAGWFFEAYAHSWFRKGGEFEADELPVNGMNSQMKFSIESQPDINYFTDARNLAKQVRLGLGGHGVCPSQIGKYFQPYEKNQESFDGVIFTGSRMAGVILLQYTMAERHGIKPNGVKAFLSPMPTTIKTIHIVFVVPEGRAENYSNKQTVEGGTFSLGREKEVRQWRLVFTDKDIESVATGGGGGVKTSCGKSGHGSSLGGGGAGEESACEGGGVSKEPAGGKRAREATSRGSARREKRVQKRTRGEIVGGQSSGQGSAHGRC